MDDLASLAAWEEEGNKQQRSLFFKLSHAEQQKRDGGWGSEKNSFCIFVVPADNVSFISASVFLPFLLESWVFFGNVTPAHPPPPSPPPYP